jgi:stringent starvation protein B
MSDAPQASSTKPYLIRGLYEWCTDNGFTPYIAVFVNAAVRVPKEYVKNHEIVLNISFEATQGLKLDNDAITFKARFAGTARDIYIPVDNVVAIYARENGQGMAFPLPPDLQQEQAQGQPAAPAHGAHGGLKLAGAQDAPEEAPAPTAPSVVPASGRRKPRPAPAPPDEPPPAPRGRPALKRIK